VIHVTERGGREEYKPKWLDVSHPLTLLQVRKLKNSEIERKDASGEDPMED